MPLHFPFSEAPLRTRPPFTLPQSNARRVSGRSQPNHHASRPFAISKECNPRDFRKSSVPPFASRVNIFRISVFGIPSSGQPAPANLC